MLTTQYLLTIYLMVTKPATLADFWEKIIPIALWVTRSRSNYWPSYLQCPLNILWTICLIITKFGTVVAIREWIIYSKQPLWILHQEGIYIFSNISCFVTYPICFMVLIISLINYISFNICSVIKNRDIP